MSSQISKITNALSVDVEDYFQVSAFEDVIGRDEWATMPVRVEVNTERLLELFEVRNVKATFFTLGWVAKKYPKLINNIVDQGHEIASHGMQHTRVTNQSPQKFKDDIVSSKQLLEDLSGARVKGYRAASFSINESNTWAWDILAESGYEYSSSISPVKHDLYGMPKASRFPFKAGEKKILEIPVSTIRLFGKNLPTGGGFFRLYPYFVSKKILKHINLKEEAPINFYFHPWEIDPGQPKVKSASIKSKFRHYTNLSRMEIKLDKMLQDFSWSSIDKVFL